MGPTTAVASFAAANAAMLQGVDGISTVHVLLSDCLALLGAQAAGVLVRRDDQQPELLAATSHDADQLELYQARMGSGPCVEAIETGRSIQAAGIDTLAQRWPDFARAMSMTQLRMIHAVPMRWHGHTLGGLNIFWSESRSLSDEQQQLAQSFADICTLALLQTPTSDEADVIAEKLRTALHGRVAIERAKGVLAQSEGLDQGEAFARLVQLSREGSRPLSDVAQSVLDDIVTRRG